MSIQLNLLVLRTTQLERLKEQYEAIGLDFEYHRHGKGPFHYSAYVGGCVLEIYPLKKEQEEADANLRLGFALENLKDYLAKMEAAGWKDIPNSVSESIKKIVLRDLDGRKVEFLAK